MQRREFITALCGAALWPLATLAQGTSKSYRIAYLALLPGERTTLAKLFLERLRDFGYDEGKNMLFEYRSSACQNSPPNSYMTTQAFWLPDLERSQRRPLGPQPAASRSFSRVSAIRWGLA